MSQSTGFRIVSWLIVISAVTARFWHPNPETVHVDTLLIIGAVGVCTASILKALGK